MAAKPVTVSFDAEVGGITSALDKVGSSAKTMAGKLDSAGDDAKRMGSRMDDVGSAVGSQEQKFSGAADVLDGLGGAFGLPTENATGLMRSFGDLSGGMEPVLGVVKSMGPLLGTMATKLGLASVATSVWTGIQWLWNAAMTANPIGIVAVAIGAITLALVAAYTQSETFRDIVDGAFRMVAKGVGMYVGFILDRISDLIGAVLSVMKWIPGMGGVRDKLREAQDGIDNLSDKVKTFGKDTDDATSKVTKFTGELAHLNKASINQAAPIFTVQKSGGVLARQHGGPVSAGSPYLVGEAGPELFVPGRSGAIVANGAGGSRQYSIVVQALDPATAAETVVRAIDAYESRNGSRYARAS